MKKSFQVFIDMNTKYCDEYFKMRISAVKSSDNFIYTMMELFQTFDTLFKLKIK